MCMCVCVRKPWLHDSLLLCMFVCSWLWWGVGHPPGRTGNDGWPSQGTELHNYIWHVWMDGCMYVWMDGLEQFHSCVLCMFTCTCTSCVRACCSTQSLVSGWTQIALGHVQWITFLLSFFCAHVNMRDYKTRSLNTKTWKLGTCTYSIIL